MKIRGAAAGNGQKIILARDPLVHAGRRKQVAEVILLEIVHVPVAHRTIGQALPDDLLGGNITVRLLGRGDQRDVGIKQLVRFRIPALGIGIDHAFHKFVEIPVAVRRAAELPVAYARGDAEILHLMEKTFGIGKHGKNMRDGRVRIGIETVQPKARPPAHGANRQRPGLGAGAFTGVSKHRGMPSFFLPQAFAPPVRWRRR